MSRYVIAGVVLTVYAALVGWFVGRTGEAHRDALRKSRVAKVQSPATPVVKTAVDAVPPPLIAKASAPPAEPTPKVAAMVPPPAVAPKDGPRPVLSPRADSLDLAHLSTADEHRLGEEIHALIMATNAPLDTGNWLRRVERAARPILETCSRSDVEYQFTVLDSDAVNAFSVPGGRIYVCRGLFDLIGEDEDFALQFVVGHEIAHVDLKHASACVAPGNAESKKQGIETVKQFLLPVVLGYPDKMEFEADAWIYQRMTTQLQQSRYKALRFLRKFNGYAEGHA